MPHLADGTHRALRSITEQFPSPRDQDIQMGNIVQGLQLQQKESETRKRTELTESYTAELERVFERFPPSNVAEIKPGAITHLQALALSEPVETLEVKLQAFVAEAVQKGNALQRTGVQLSTQTIHQFSGFSAGDSPSERWTTPRWAVILGTPLTFP